MAEQGVIANSAGQGVVVRAAIEGIVSGFAIQTARLVEVYAIVPRRGMQPCLRHLRPAPFRSVAKFDFLDLVGVA